MPRKRSQPDACDMPGDDMSGLDPSNPSILRLPLVEEILEAHIVERQQGNVFIHKRVETQPVQARLELHHDDVVIERIALNELATKRRQPWYEGNTLLIPVYDELIVTETKLRLREVIRLHNRGRIERINLKGAVRLEIVDIEETDAQR